MSYLKHHKVLMIVAIIAVIGGSIVFSHRNSSTTENEIEKTHVTLIAAGETGKNFGIAADGVIESLNQVELRSQVSAPVTSVEVKIGMPVVTGQTLVTLQNADYIAQLNQAKAGLAAQEASLQNLKNGAKSEDLRITETGVKKAEQDVQNAYDNIPNALQDAYAKAEDATRKQIDALYANDEENPVLTFPISDAQAKIDAESLRESASNELDVWKKELQTLSGQASREAYDIALKNAKSHLAVIKNCLNRTMDAVVANVNLAQSTTDAYKASITAGRTSVNAAISAIQGQEQSIVSLKFVLENTQNQLASQKAGATDEQIAAQTAVVAQAAASVQNLEAQVAKTIVRAPVDGVISAVPVKIGDLLTPGSSVASIVNVNALQIKAYISEEDMFRIAEGNSVMLEGKSIGKVSRVAPSINTTLKKIEVNILIDDASQKDFIVGQNINVQIAENSQGVSAIYLPIRAVRIGDAGTFIYKINNESKVDEIIVKTGNTKGEYIEITSGISFGDKIVSDAYGIAKGQEVIVDTK